MDPSPEAKQKYEQVMQAYEVLSSPRSKLDYDTQLVVPASTSLTEDQQEFLKRVKERYLEREEQIRLKNLELDSNLHFSKQLYLAHHKEYLERLEQYRLWEGLDQPYFERYD
jgi:hypothetical protein